MGRTGAGKTSLISSMYRLTEPSGDIRIDGISIGDLGLHDLRSRLSIIPQEPAIFSNTLRKNLDPSNQKSDDELWKVLEEVIFVYLFCGFFFGTPSYAHGVEPRVTNASYHEQFDS